MGEALWLMRLKFVLQKNSKHHVMKLWGYSWVAKISNIHPHVPQINWPSRFWREGYTSSKSATKGGREGPFNEGQQWPGWTSPPAKGLHSRETLCRRLLHFPLLSLSVGKTEQTLENRPEVPSLLSVPGRFGDYIPFGAECLRLWTVV